MSSGLVVDVLSVSTASPITVRFTLKDDRGYPIDINGVYSLNTVIQPRFGLAYTSLDQLGNQAPYTVLTNSGSTPQPTAFNPASAGQGTLVQNGYGDYTYTFPTTTTPGGAQAVAYDPAKLSNTHVVWIQVTRQTNLDNPDDPRGFSAVDKDYWFVPAGGAPVKRELVTTANCNKCHRGFAPGERSVAGSTFHSGGRIEAGFCGICHNPGRTSNPAAEAKVFVHRIHASADLQAANLFHNIKIEFPQDVRNCDACHAGAAQGAQAKGNPSRAACGSCHDYVSFTGAGASTCAHPTAKDANGVNVTCNHFGGPQADDGNCTACHPAVSVTRYHVAVAPPDPSSTRAGGTNANTNASFLAAAGAVPTGAKKVTYEVSSVDAISVGPGAFQPAITFRFLVDGVPTPMQTYAAGVTTEIFAGFVGSPSVYFAFAVPQDGIAAPADFNATVNSYIKNIWNGTATGTAAGTLTGPDANQWYTIQLTGVNIPATARMVTGGVGYSYSLSSTPPLVQIDLPAYPYNVAISGYPYITAGSFQGGLSVPAPDVWKVANGHIGRRPIVDNAKCQTCHVALGAVPTFHAGQRNDGPTCSFCHTPNRTSSGWSASAKGFIHALHGARVRSVPFTWHATTPLGYSEVEFPGRLNDCTACHVDGGYNFTAPAVTNTSGTSTSGTKNGVACTVAAPCTCGTGSNACVLTDSGAGAYANVLASTVATGTFTIPAPPAVNTISPYVVADGVTSYGTGYSFAAATGVSTEATGATLVNSPITAACVGCHDSPMAIDHMQAMGGKFYEARSTALAAGAPLEQCVLCHGPNTIASTATMHIY